MLKTNSKKARENIREYIVEHFDASNYTDDPPKAWPEIAAFILETFQNEKYYSTKYMYRVMLSDERVFIDWCQGLPSVLDTCYYYNRSAVDDLGAILEESESEKAKYTETAAEAMLTRLIFRELMKGAGKA